MGKFAKDATPYIVTVLSTIFSIVVGKEWLTTGGGDPAAFLTWTISVLLIGLSLGLGIAKCITVSDNDETEKAKEHGVFAKIGSTPSNLSPAAMRALAELDDNEASCMIALANLSSIDVNGAPDKPLITIPSSERCTALGVDCAAISRLVERGILTRHEAKSVKVVRKKNVGGRWVDSITPCEEIPRERVTTWSSSGNLTPAFIGGATSKLVYPDSPLRYTAIGKEVAAACARKSIPDAVVKFDEEWHSAASKVGPMRM